VNRIQIPVVFPAHPRTRYQIRHEQLKLSARVRLLEPLGYLELASLASQAQVIVTDSGGLQKEAYWYGVPCVTLRPSTEWVDTVELGANVLVDDDPDLIASATGSAEMPKRHPKLYGDGKAAERITEGLLATMPAR
jgi:UDP-N-acetylglucosamine 2-epimerase